MNNNPNEETSSSQCARILAHLQSGKKLTSMEALYKYGCARLASRINDLRNVGHTIRSERIRLDNGKIIARYYIE